LADNLRVLKTVSLLILLFFCRCASRQAAVADYERLDLERAEEKLSDASLPYRQCKDAVWLSLDRAMVRWTQNKLEESLNDFSSALDAIDYYQQKSIPEELSKTIFQDDLGAYQPAPFEVTLARLYYAFALLQKKDEDNAAALLYYLENRQTEQENPLATSVLALLLERRGDASNADLLYRRIKMERPSEAKATLLCALHQGVVPKKVSVLEPISIVSAAALETILGMRDVRPALSTLRGIPVPKLEHQPFFPPIGVRLDGEPLSFPLTYDVKEAGALCLEKELPQTALRAAARLIMRRALVASSKQNHTFLDLAIWVANTATEADTRAWGMLPSRISLVRVDLEPGHHIMEIDGKSISFELKKGDLHTVHFVCPKPQKTLILENIP